MFAVNPIISKDPEVVKCRSSGSNERLSKKGAGYGAFWGDD
jgi:hypothetical protein